MLAPMVIVQEKVKVTLSFINGSGRHIQANG
jgi:hypothetical protein